MYIFNFLDMKNTYLVKLVTGMKNYKPLENFLEKLYLNVYYVNEPFSKYMVIS